MTLPCCPHCKEDDTLVAVEAVGYGVIECECTECAAVVLVNAEGQIVWRDVRDVSGNLIDGP